MIDNKRDEAIEQAWQDAESKFKSDPNYLLGATRNPKQYLVHGFDAGIKWLTDGDDFKTAQKMLRGAIEEMEKPAASIDRVQVVREAFEEVKRNLRIAGFMPDTPYVMAAMEIVLAEMEVKNESQNRVR